MKPYYEHDGITIYCGDCREILPQLGPNSVDLIVTDPPYGVKWFSGRGSNMFTEIAGDHSTEAAVESLKLAIPVLRRKRHVYLFGRYDLSSVLGIGPRSELIWDKQMFGLGNLASPWGPQHEYIQFFASVREGAGSRDKFGSGAGSARLRRGSVLSFPRPNGSAVSSHPTEKPVLLMRELIECSSRIGETVLDYFCGVGGTLIAAKLEGRRAIGIEIEEKYCAIAARRVEAERLTLFEHAGIEQQLNLTERPEA